MSANGDPEADSVPQLWQACMDAGNALREFAAPDWPGDRIDAADAAARRASLCFG